MEFDKGGRPPKPDDEKAIKFSASIPAELYERLAKYCKAEERDRSYAIRKSLEYWLKKKGF